MPIKEEPIRIEFQYEKENAKTSDDELTSDGAFDVAYYTVTDEGDEKKYVRLTPHGTTENSIFELDFLVEVVDFLRRKGVIEKIKVETGGVVDIADETYLPLPRIQTINGEVKAPGGLTLPTVKTADSVTESSYVPVSSFTTDAVDTLPTPNVVKSTKGDSPIIISEGMSTENIIRRPVIRTEVGANEDTMKGLIDSKNQRQVNPQKVIKRREADEI